MAFSETLPSHSPAIFGTTGEINQSWRISNSENLSTFQILNLTKTLIHFPKEVKVLLDPFAAQVFSTLNVRRKTLATYKSMYRCHISPNMGLMNLADINRSDIKRTLWGLPPQTGQMTLAVIKMLFREAMELELIEKSPVHGIKNPKVIVQSRRFLTWDEINGINFGKYNHHIRFLALHGLRWGEAVALTHDDVRDGKIYVNKSVHGATKSAAGVRVVPLIGEFLPLPKHPRTLRKVLAPYGITIHSLRHTYAYILKKQGIHVTTAQRLLGHSDPKITLSVYTRVLDNEIDDAGSVLTLMVKKDSLIGDEKSEKPYKSAYRSAS